MHRDICPTWPCSEERVYSRKNRSVFPVFWPARTLAGAMIDHTGFNVSNLELSRAFYLKALAPLGYGISLEFEGAAGFGAAQGAGGDPGGDFWISAGEPQIPRVHLAFRAASEQQVQWISVDSTNNSDKIRPRSRPTFLIEED